MPEAAVTALDPRATCTTCGRPLPPESAVCPGCGAAHGESNRCPHCHAIADVEPHPALGFRCLVCGAPRVALDIAGVTPSRSTTGALSAAGKWQTQHVIYSAVGGVLGAMGALALLIATLVVLAAAPGPVPVVAAYLGALVPTIAGGVCLARAAAARKQRHDALHASQISALADVQAVTGVLEAKRVAEIMRLPTERAELLLAEASVATLLEQAPAPRLRVPLSAPTEPGSPPFEDTSSHLGASRARTARGDTEI